MLNIAKYVRRTGDTAVTTLLYAGLAIAVVIFAFVYSLSSRVTPYADEWMMLLYGPVSVNEFVKWLFSVHVDHRIVIQRLIQQGVIYFNGYDFRTLTLVNSLMMVVASGLMLEVLRMARGRSSWIDFAVISSLCAAGTNAVIWSSAFAFPATNLAIIAFSHSWMLQLKNGTSQLRQYYALVALLAGPFISAGGMVASTTLMLSLIWLRYFRRNVTQPLSGRQLIALLIVCIGSWLLYEPSGASGIRLDRLMDFIVGVSGGSLYLDHWGHQKLKDLLMLCAIIVTGLIMLHGLMRHDEHFAPQLPVAAILLATGAVALSVVGRSANTEWSTGLALHYGIITAPVVPIICFVLAQTKAGRPFAIILLALSLASYQHSLKSTKRNLRASREHNERVLRQLVESNDLQQTLSDHWLDYWYRDGDRSLIPSIADKARYLQQHGGRMYEEP